MVQFTLKDPLTIIIYNLVKCAVLEGKIIHNGDGNELREYIHAADASKLSVDVIESEDFKNLHVTYWK